MKKYKHYYLTSESVTEGHPDKVADLISDAILDECLKQDKESRVAVETLISKDKVVVAGQITSNATIDIEKIVREKLKEEGYSCTLANARFVKPFDKELVDRLAKNHRLIVTMEENVLQGGFGLPVTAYIHEHYPQVKVMNIALPDAYVEHGNVSVLRKGLGIDSDSIIQRLKAEGWL